EENIPTHYVDANIDEAMMTVIPATVFGDGLEVICRYRAVGSFLRRYGKYAEEGQALDGFVEVTVEYDQQADTPIDEDATVMLGILTEDEDDQLYQLTKKTAQIVKDELAKKDIELYDIKFEFGKDQQGTVMLIDEISGGNMRAYKD